MNYCTKSTEMFWDQKPKLLRSTRSTWQIYKVYKWLPVIYHVFCPTKAAKGLLADEQKIIVIISVQYFVFIWQIKHELL